MSLKILILGVNGFIGSHLSEKILKTTDWEVYGMDLSNDKLGDTIGHPRFHFVEGDITINKEWIEYHVRKCDVVLPLVAIATPAIYVSDPLRVFELDFEANLAVVRYCVRYNKRVVFPSTSEVYGMSPDEEFDEETSNLVLGPIGKQRWIYSCSKQLLDRVIHAYGLKNQLRYTLFRSSRVLTQFLGNILRGKEIQLVDGGAQKRCFIYIDDAIDALMKIIENKDGIADQRIFNIGFPDAELSIAELAEMMLDVVSEFPGYENVRDRVPLINVDSGAYYGKGYQDMLVRVPSIKAISELGWKPSTNVRTAIRKTVEYYIDQFSEGVAKSSEQSDL